MGNRVIIAHVVNLEGAHADAIVEVTNKLHVFELCDNWVSETFLKQVVISLLDFTCTGCCKLLKLKFFLLRLALPGHLLISDESLGLLKADLLVSISFDGGQTMLKLF